MQENTVLKAIATCHPVKSSFAKLTKETGMARNEIEEVVTGLKKIGFVNVTPGNEVYFMEDGRNHLGITSVPTAKSAQDKEERKPVVPALLTSALVARKPVVKQKVARLSESTIETQQNGVLTSIDELAIKLNKPVIKITDCDLKGQALARLADLMSEDIAELLLDIKADLERAAA